MAMEINGLNSSQTNTNKARNGQGAVTPKAGTPAEAAAAAKSSGDTVQISSQAQTLNRLQSQVGKEAPVNREKVEALKSAIAGGTYKPDAQAIAKRMLDSDQMF